MRLWTRFYGTTGETRYITRSVGSWDQAILFVISDIFLYQLSKKKEIISLGPEKTVCYIRYFVISDLFISSFHYIGDCNMTSDIKVL